MGEKVKWEKRMMMHRAAVGECSADLIVNTLVIICSFFWFKDREKILLAVGSSRVVFTYNI